MTDKRSSQILIDMLQDQNHAGDLTFFRIVQYLGDRAYGLSILFFALPSALPISAIPGIALFFSMPIFLLSVQMILMKKNLWLPKKLGTIKIPHEKLKKIIQAAIPYLQKIEKWLKPRLSFMTSVYMDIMNGIILLCLSILLMLPIPFSNYLLATLIIIFSLGLIEKDGVFIATAYVGTFLYVSLVYSVILTVLKSFFN